jgi:hypothetical protein
MHFSKDEIKDQFKQVISYSQGITDPKVDRLFDQWLEAKRDFIEAMDGKLIYESPEKITFSLDQKERQSRIDDFISIVESRWDNYKLANFISDMRDGFFNNMVLYDYEINGHTIKKGMKLIKAFKFFEEDKNALTDIQNYASRIIQEDKIEGTLCLSVHPLDYLSASENTYNWRSCHALDGEYRSGNLSYMVDSSTMICYLKSDREEMLPNFPFKWNSKKWRVFLYFSNDWNMLMAGRQYPFSTDVGMKYILDELMRKSGLSRNSCWTPWHDELLKNVAFGNGEGRFNLNHLYIPVGNELIKLEDLVRDNPGSMQFNDLLRSSFYTPMYSYRQYGRYYEQYWSNECGQTSATDTRFYIGGAVDCLRCGCEDIQIGESMQCIECEEEYGSLDTDDFGYCSCCNRHIYLDNAHWIGDEVLCDQCLETETSRCDHCGQIVFNSEISFNRELEEYICSDCQENYEEAKEYRRRLF